VVIVNEVYWKAIMSVSVLVAGAGFFAALLSHFRGEIRRRVIKAAIISVAILPIWYLFTVIALTLFLSRSGVQE
jgi:hypothetical protein